MAVSSKKTSETGVAVGTHTLKQVGTIDLAVALVLAPSNTTTGFGSISAGSSTVLGDSTASLGDQKSVFASTSISTNTFNTNPSLFNSSSTTSSLGPRPGRFFAPFQGKYRVDVNVGATAALAALPTGETVDIFLELVTPNGGSGDVLQIAHSYLTPVALLATTTLALQGHLTTEVLLQGPVAAARQSVQIRIENNTSGTVLLSDPVLGSTIAPIATRVSIMYDASTTHGQALTMFPPTMSLPKEGKRTKPEKKRPAREKDLKAPKESKESKDAKLHKYFMAILAEPLLTKKRPALLTRKEEEEEQDEEENEEEDEEDEEDEELKQFLARVKASMAAFTESAVSKRSDPDRRRRSRPSSHPK